VVLLDNCFADVEAQSQAHHGTLGAITQYFDALCPVEAIPDVELVFGQEAYSLVLYGDTYIVVF